MLYLLIVSLLNDEADSDSITTDCHTLVHKLSPVLMIAQQFNSILLAGNYKLSMV